MAHALLSPSSADRWLQCTPSARLESREDDKAGDAADEGTLAHKLSELLLKLELKLIDKKAFKTYFARIRTNRHHNDSMLEYCEQFVSFVMEQYSSATESDPGALIFLEVIIDLTEWIPEGFGTGDVVIVANGFFHIIDFKYGKGIKVDAVNNKQMMLYGLGIYFMYSVLFEADEVMMTIFQPRIDNFSTFTISVKKLLSWAESYLRKQAAAAWKGKGEFVPGDHCTFCRVRTTCKANADYQMELAAFEFKEGIHLTAKEIAAILNKIAPLISWANAVKEYALQEAIKGKKWPGHKLVEGKSSRILTQPERIKTLLVNKGFDEADFLSQPALLGITALERNIGKLKLLKLIGKYINKPEGKPVLVNSKDPRPEYNATEAAKKIFKD